MISPFNDKYGISLSGLNIYKIKKPESHSSTSANRKSGFAQMVTIQTPI